MLTYVLQYLYIIWSFWNEPTALHYYIINITMHETQAI